MTEYPVNVSKSDNGDYVAQLADVPDGPTGTGIDPYAALEDLTTKAQSFLATLQNKGTLPAPSPADDRPTVCFDDKSSKQTSAMDDSRKLVAAKGAQSAMIGYSWTNSAIFRDD